MAERPCTVAYIIDDLGLGGAQRQLVELIKVLPRERYTAHVISLSMEQVAYAPALRAARVPLTLIAHRGAWSWGTLVAVYRALRQMRPTIVHTWLFTAGLYGRVAAWLGRVPVILCAIRSVEDDKPRHYVAVDRVLRHVTQAFTVNARAIGEVLARRERVPAERIVTIYNGVDLQAFQPSPDGAIRRRLGLQSENPLVGIVGRLAPVKDHETFLQAVARIAATLPSARFLVVGDGPRQAALQALAQTLGLADRLWFWPSQSRVADILAALDVVVVSSRYEGCSNVILEAMAMGKPVVATAVGGNPELVLAGATGELVPPQDPSSLADRVVQLLSHPQRARAMGAAARQRITARFGLDQMVAQMTAWYDTVVAAQEARSGR
ncbi:MAG: glycosyltransferase [Candidatus Omnitrophica bacterium]|nr:glycosyltransferase [Candidatus Omnitrophota bacterium]